MPNGFHEGSSSSSSLAHRRAAVGACDAWYDDRWSGSLVRHGVVLAAIIAAGLMALAFDVPLARAMVHGKALHFLHGFLGAIEPFGQPTAILFTAAAIALCDSRRGVAMPRLLAASLGSGLAADLLKLLVARTRPHHHDLAGSVLDTFRECLPELGAASSQQSWPSAHTATAFGFALSLATLFPAGRRLFFFAATLVALQRVEAGAHYLSDTFWGAAVGYAVCLTVFHPNLLGAWFDRKERTRAIGQGECLNPNPGAPGMTTLECRKPSQSNAA